MIITKIIDRHNNNNRNHRGGYRGRGNFRSRGGFRGRGGRGRRGGYNSRGGYRNNYHNNHRHENQNKNNDSEEVEESRKRKNDGIICHKCGRANHIARDCYANNAGGRKKFKHRAYTAIDDDDDCAYSCIDSQINTETVDLSQVWILDSGATSHHTCNRELLTHIKQLYKPKTTITGDGESTVNEYGNAWLDTDDVLFELVNVN